MTYAAVRIRGNVNIKPDIKKTLQLLNLTRANHCTLLEEKPTTNGMLNVVKDYVTWGEINKDMLTKLVKERGRLEGDKQLTNEYIKSATTYDTIDKLVKAMVDNKFKYKEIPNIKKVFRLNPPKKGYISVKRPYTKKGSLGYRGKEINKLIERMI
jgi:large subunit ribosomal protein L30